MSAYCMPALQLTLSTRVVDVVSEWGSLYVLLRDGRVRCVLAHVNSECNCLGILS